MLLLLIRRLDLSSDAAAAVAAAGGRPARGRAFKAFQVEVRPAGAVPAPGVAAAATVTRGHWQGQPPPTRQRHTGRSALMTAGLG
jgi:hypothetical protein